MSLSLAASMVLVVGALTTLVAGALWTRAWRGRVTGWKSCCGACGFELRGLNPCATACPECGRGLSGATLRPAASERDPWRWALAIAVTALGITLVWLGRPGALLSGARMLCTPLPDRLLLPAFEFAPRAAFPELERRVLEGSLDPSEVADAARRAARLSAANPRDRIGDAGRLLVRLDAQNLIDAALATELLPTCLGGTDLVAGQPRPPKPGGLFIATARLPLLQGTQWIGQRSVQLTIETAEVDMPDGSVQRLERVSNPERALRREFDGAAFKAPDSTGRFGGRLGIRLQQPGGGFVSQAQAAFELEVVDPSKIRMDPKPDAAAARALEAWARQASSSCDVSGKLVVSLPGDLTALQELQVSIAARLLVEQDGLQLEVGRIWVDETAPSVELVAVPMPEALDRSRSATLVLKPDLELALAKASSSGSMLSETVSVPIGLPARTTPAPTPSPNSPG